MRSERAKFCTFVVLTEVALTTEKVRRDSIITRLWVERPENRISILGRAEILLFTTASRLLLHPNG